MRIRRMAISAAFAAGLAGVPLAAAEAQYYPPCSFPLEWPFCAAGAVLGTAATIVTAPIAAVTAPAYPYGYYGYPHPGWRPGWGHRRWCRNHPYRCRW